MEVMGNMFTITITLPPTSAKRNKESTNEIKSGKSNFNILLSKEEDAIPLPPESPFSDWKEARRYAGPLPFTFTYNSKTAEVLIIEGVRQNWTPSTGVRDGLPLLFSGFTPP
nr:hypothetical protein [Haliscomenobacter sp.]